MQKNENKMTPEKALEILEKATGKDFYVVEYQDALNVAMEALREKTNPVVSETALRDNYRKDRTMIVDILNQFERTINMGEIVKLQFHDADINEHDGILKTYYLVNPDRGRLVELRNKVDNRFDEEDYDDRDGYWDVIDDFVRANFSVIEISDTFVIEY